MPKTDVLPMLAVVPFEFNVANKGHLDVVGEILANNLIAKMQRSLQIKVISRLSTTRFRYIDWSCSEIKSKLECDFVLHGHYTESANELHIQLRLTHISTEQDVWTDELRCSVRDILATDSAFVDNIATTTERRIIESSVSGSPPAPESLGSLETHALYINGMNYMHSEDASEFLLSRDCFLQITQRQPFHSTVYALLSLWHLLQTQRTGGWSLRDKQENTAMMRRYIEKSLELNPGNEYAMALRGVIEVQMFKNIDLGLELIGQSLLYNRNDPRIHSCCSLVYLSAGRYDDALVSVQQSIELSPLDPQLEFFYALAAAALYSVGRYDQAELYALRSIELNPNHTSPFRTIIATQVALQKLPLAKENARRLMLIEPDFNVASWLKHWSGNKTVGEQFAAYLRAAGIPG